MTRSEFAVWMSREIQIEMLVEQLREMYPDLLLPELRQRAAAQLDAAWTVPAHLAGGYRQPEPSLTALFPADIDHKIIHMDDERTYTDRRLIRQTDRHTTKCAPAHYSLRWLWRGRPRLPFSMAVYRNDLFMAVLVATAWIGIAVRVPSGFHRRWRACFGVNIDIGEAK